MPDWNYQATFLNLLKFHRQTSSRERFFYCLETRFNSSFRFASWICVNVQKTRICRSNIFLFWFLQEWIIFHHFHNLHQLLFYRHSVINFPSKMFLNVSKIFLPRFFKSGSLGESFLTLHQRQNQNDSFKFIPILFSCRRRSKLRYLFPIKFI